MSEEKKTELQTRTVVFIALCLVGITAAAIFFGIEGKKINEQQTQLNLYCEKNVGTNFYAKIDKVENEFQCCKMFDLINKVDEQREGCASPIPL